MDILQKNFTFPYKLIRTHFLFHFISFLFCTLNYIYLFSYKQKYFYVTFVTFQTLLAIFMIQVMCMIKNICFNFLDPLKCALNVYILISLIFLILIIVNFILIFQINNYNNKFKILLLSLSLMYYILDGMIFIVEYYVIFKQIKKSISERILMQINQNGNIENKNTKNDTQMSDKTNKNENYEKESTIYIIYDNNHNINDKKNKDDIKDINNNIFSEINNDNPTICNFESNIIRIRRNNKRNFFENKFKTVHNPKIKIMNEEENSSKSFDKSDINLPINKELKK